MSLAWLHFNEALHTLTGPESQRERLFEALVLSLSGLDRKEVPGEVQPLFDRLMVGLHDNASAPVVRARIQGTIDHMDEPDVVAAIACIIEVYDAVTRYQPTAVRPRQVSSALAMDQDPVHVFRGGDQRVGQADRRRDPRPRHH
jgi:hypothetical protein